MEVFLYFCRRANKTMTRVDFTTNQQGCNDYFDVWGLCVCVEKTTKMLNAVLRSLGALAKRKKEQQSRQQQSSVAFRFCRKRQ